MTVRNTERNTVWRTEKEKTESPKQNEKTYPASPPAIKELRCKDNEKEDRMAIVNRKTKAGPPGQTVLLGVQHQHSFLRQYLLST